MARSSIYPPSVQPGLPEEWPLPSSWEWTPLAQLIDVIERPAHIQNGTEYQLVTAKRNRGGIVARERLLGKAILTKSQFFVEARDFVISRRQIIHGACGIVPTELHGAVVSNEYAALRVRQPLELHYLRLLSHTQYFQKTCFQSSVGVDVEKMVFRLERWLNFRLPLPPPVEQRRITDVLATADAAIEAAEYVVRQSEKVKRGAVDHLLARGMPGRHKRFKSTEIGRIPESWKVVPLHAVLSEEIRNGYSPVCGETPTGRYMLSLAAVTFAGFNASGVKHAPSDDPRLLGAQLRAGDIVVSRSNTPERVGLAGLYEGVPSPCFFPDLLMRVRVGAAVLGRIVLEQLLSPRGRRYLTAAARGTSASMVKINREVLGSFKVALPSVDEQQQIAAAIDAIDVSRHSQRETLSTLESVRNGLRDDLLTGRVRVPG